MPKSLYTTQKTFVHKFKIFILENVVKVWKAVSEHMAYEKLARELPNNFEDPSSLQELEEIDPIYKILVLALNVN